MRLTRYKNTINIEKNNNDRFKILSDGGTVYNSRQSYSNNKFGAWWSQQGQTPFRLDQKDWILKTIDNTLIFDFHWSLKLDLYILWNPGIQNYNQEHDAVFAHQPDLDLYVLSTYEHTWIKCGKGYASVDFHVSESLGSLGTTLDDHKALDATIKNYLKNLLQELAA